MEQKNKVKPNVRIEPKVSTNKAIIDNSLSNKENVEEKISAINKADDMETGFVKTRKTTLLHDISNTNTQNTKQENLTTEDVLFVPPHMEKINTIKESNASEDNTPPTNSTKKSLQIVLGPSACITAFVTILVTMLFIFLFGLIIGKGMVPTPTKIEPEKLAPQVQKEKEKTEVLPKEKLQFMTSLKTETVEEPTASEKTDAKVDTKTDKAKAEVKTKAKAEPVIIPSTTLYDFNIRVAAFRNKDQSDTLREKLEGIGFRTRQIIEKDTKKKNWYFVHVLLRGTETRLKEAQESFKKFAIRDSIIKEKNEIK